MIFDVVQYRKRLLVSVVTCWLLFFLTSDESVSLLLDYGYFLFVGLLGAIVANSTGAGGGIIFIPFFNALGITGSQALGTSILIQCFGMTAGAIAWLTTSHIAKTNSHHLNKLIYQLLMFGGGASIIGILTGQYLLASMDSAMMVQIFKVFSIIFGIILLVIVYFNRTQTHTRFDLAENDVYLLITAGFIGGIVTSWISVGVGEIIAIALILRRYPTMVAISMGVVISAVSVLSAAFHHIVTINSVNWLVIMFAVPGAILGGTFAYLLSEKLGPTRLKIFFSIWIILTGLLM